MEERVLNQKSSVNLRPSRFLVDLSQRPNIEEIKQPIPWWERLENWLFSVDEKITEIETIESPQDALASELQIDNFVLPSERLTSDDNLIERNLENKNKSETTFVDLNEYKKEVKSHFEELSKETSGNTPLVWPVIFKKLDQRFNRLAFYGLIKIFILAVYKIVYLFLRFAYSIGWLVTFSCKFIGNLLYKVFSPFVRIIKPIHNIFSKITITLIFTIGKMFLAIGSLFDFKKIRKEVQVTKIDESHQYAPAVNLQKKFEKKKELVKRESLSVLLNKKIYNVRQFIADFTWRDLLPRPRLSFARNAISFSLILLILVLPVFIYLLTENIKDKKGKVLGASESAIDNLVDASQSAKVMDFSKASADFSEASENFLNAQKEMSDISLFISTLAKVIPNDDLQLAVSSKNIINAGIAASQMGDNFSQALSSLFSGNKNISEALNKFSEYSKKISENSREVSNNLAVIDPKVLPEDYQKKFIEIQKRTAELDGVIIEFNDWLEKIKLLIGQGKDKRYLLVFQNNTEARATGGFIGSFALVDLHDGQIKNIETPGGGTYDTEAGLFMRIISPEPLHMVNPLWHMWDANWWPDWTKSAKKLMWFYEKSDGPTVDGVISLTPTVVEKLLAAIGPIDMKANYGLEINDKNFWIEAQRLSEQKPDVTTKPKQFIGDLMNKIVATIPERLNKDVIINLILAFEESLSQKHILLYFTDLELQSKISEYGWDGKIKNTQSDYLLVANSSVAGGKSDKKIKQTISHKAVIANDGTVIDDLVIKREHTAGKGEEFTGQRNVDYIRVYVPEGSELIDASGFAKPDEAYFEQPDSSWRHDPELQNEENAQIDSRNGVKIYKESGKTVFAQWTIIDPGQTVELHYRYKLPFKVEAQTSEKSNLDTLEKIMKWLDNVLDVPQPALSSYSILFQKQSGSLDVLVNSQAVFDSAYKFLWHYPDQDENYIYDKDNIAWEVSDDLNVDRLFLVAVEKK